MKDIGYKRELLKGIWPMAAAGGCREELPWARGWRVRLQNCPWEGVRCSLLPIRPSKSALFAVGISLPLLGTEWRGYVRDLGPWGLTWGSASFAARVWQHMKGCHFRLCCQSATRVPSAARSTRRAWPTQVVLWCKCWAPQQRYIFTALFSQVIKCNVQVTSDINSWKKKKKKTQLRDFPLNASRRRCSGAVRDPWLHDSPSRTESSAVLLPHRCRPPLPGTRTAGLRGYRPHPGPSVPAGRGGEARPGGKLLPRAGGAGAPTSPCLPPVRSPRLSDRILMWADGCHGNGGPGAPRRRSARPGWARGAERGDRSRAAGRGSSLS